MKTAQAFQRMWLHAVKKLRILKWHVSYFLKKIIIIMLALSPSFIPGSDSCTVNVNMQSFIVV